MQSIAETVRGARTIHLVLFLSIILYVFVGEMLHPASQDIPASMQYGFLICAGGMMVLAVVFRRMTAGQAEEVLRRDPDDAVAIARWRTGQLVSYVLAESVALFGFALRYLGVSFGRALLFYGAAIILMVAFRLTDPRS